MNKPFARVSFSERDNFISYLATNPLYINKISFVEGNEEIPNQIWIKGKPYASLYNNQLTNQGLTENEVRNIIKEYVDSNNNEIYDWEEYHDTQSDPTNVWGVF